MTHRAGFACLAGRPNTGKSTLVNALVGTKVAITSDRPQTTRRAVRGIRTRTDGQLVLVDTPGLHRPRTMLGERLNDVVRSTWAEVDVVAFCVAADMPVGPGDRLVAAEVARLRARKVAVVTKSDAVSRETVAAQLLGVTELADWDAVVPVSALTGEQVEVLAGVLIGLMPEGPALYPADDVTDEPELVRVAELIREAALDGVRDELPHSIAVVVEEMAPREGRPQLVDVRADLYVERSSQKAIVIGRGGSRLRDVGSVARREIEALLGRQVHLDLHVRVAKEWQRDPKQLRKLGF